MYIFRKLHKYLFSLSLSLLHPFHIGNKLGVCSKNSIPPCERWCVVSDEVHVVEIMVPRSGIERDEVQRVERNVITTETKITKIMKKQLIFSLTVMLTNLNIPFYLSHFISDMLTRAKYLTKNSAYYRNHLRNFFKNLWKLHIILNHTF